MKNRKSNGKRIPIPEEVTSLSQYREMKDKLDRLFVNITKIQDKTGWLPTRYEVFVENSTEMYEKLSDALDFSEVLRGMKTERIQRRLSPRGKSMNKLLVYLGLVESIGTAITDVVLFLLIANGMEMHTRGAYTKHVTSLKELSKLDLVYKLDFLDSHGFSTFGDSMINRNLRNNIGHLKLRIERNGEIEDKGKNPIRIDNEIANFWGGVNMSLQILREIGFMDWLQKHGSNSKKKQGAKP